MGQQASPQYRTQQYIDTLYTRRPEVSIPGPFTVEWENPGKAMALTITTSSSVFVC